MATTKSKVKSSMQKKQERLPTQIYWAILPGIAALLLDQCMKVFTAQNLKPNQSLPILEQSWLRWTRVPNSGLIYQNFEMVYKPENALWTRYIPASVLVLMGFIFIKAIMQAPKNIVTSVIALGFGLFWFSGASNVLSHFLSVFVDDTISARFVWGGRFYTFNIADMGITLGMILVLAALLPRHKTESV